MMVVMLVVVGDILVGCLPACEGGWVGGHPWVAWIGGWLEGWLAGRQCDGMPRVDHASPPFNQASPHIPSFPLQVGEGKVEGLLSPDCGDRRTVLAVVAVLLLAPLVSAT